MANAARIDHINIGLILLSCGVAFIIPFELFLFSYAVLGPLHYLTEITWLHKRNYFSLKTKDWRILYAAGVAILAFSFSDEVALWFVGNDASKLPRGVITAVLWMNEQSTGLTFFAFASALIMILVKSPVPRVGAYFILALVGYGLSKNFGNSDADPRFFYLLFAIFLPTLIHVFLFTAAFMLFGALKSQSKTGLFSVFLLLLCAASFFVVRPDGLFEIGRYAKESYDESFFGLNVEVLRILVPAQVLSEGQLLESGLLHKLVYSSNWGLVITRFIAFAYTYHYLNWFSKTKIIRWHEVPRPWLISVFILWALSIGLYAYNYQVGLMALYFLSFLHVFVEFPLNWVSFKGIGEEIGKVGRWKNAAPG